MYDLVIVESASKAKTIQGYLNSINELKKNGKQYVVMASLGHVTDLPKKELGIDKTTWVATYHPISGKQNVIQNLRTKAKDATLVYIASDPDMEGEAIAQHIKNTLKLRNPLRITFNEITKSALKKAVLNPHEIDDRMVEAQETRRILDRIVGYELSPLLWRHFNMYSLSAGRVQSVALKIVCDRLDEVKTHIPTCSWEMHAQFMWNTTPFSTRAHVRDTNAIAQWNDESHAVKVLRYLVKESHTWQASFNTKTVKKNPNAPFVTSSLQQEAYNKLHVNAKRTMQVAQELYEKGFITYMRTDSPLLSTFAQNAIAEYITMKFGHEYTSPRQYKPKVANAQHAHECIRPTKIGVTPYVAPLDGIHKKIYDMIWCRTIASQMKYASYLETCVTISCDNVSRKLNNDFRGKKEILIDDGFMKLYKASSSHVDELLMPTGPVMVTVHNITATATVPHPPPLYNEPGLVRCLEKSGIGRPSTYATIIDKLIDRGYVKRGTSPYLRTMDIHDYSCDVVPCKKSKIVPQSRSIPVGCSENDKFIPTDIGERVVRFLLKAYPDIVDKHFTAIMETNLDGIAEGTTTKCNIMNSFYASFSQAVSKTQHGHITSPKTNNNKVRSFEHIGANIVNTKYGVALFVTKTRKFISLQPFLEWRQKDVMAINDNDVMFLMSLPVKVSSTQEVHMGRYGLYIKEGIKNMSLKKGLWDDFYKSHCGVPAIL